MEQKFKVGDIVPLKSGGPNMTVSGYDVYGYDDTKTYLCRWFDEKHKPSELTFSGDELERVHP